MIVAQIALALLVVCLLIAGVCLLRMSKMYRAGQVNPKYFRGW